MLAAVGGEPTYPLHFHSANLYYIPLKPTIRR